MSGRPDREAPAAPAGDAAKPRPPHWRRRRPPRDAALAAALEAVPLPPGGPAAADRARKAVDAAFAARRAAIGPLPRSRRRTVAAAVGVGALALVLAAVPTAPGAAVAGWVGGVLRPAPSAPPPPSPAARAALGPLPAGRLLVTAGDRAFIVDAHGGRTSLGRWSGAAWSPRGKFVAAWRGRELAALAPDGRVAWRLVTRGPVHDAAWSPDGFRIAFRAGDRLAVVAGDGTGARVLAAPVRPTAPAWRPTDPRTLAWIGAGGGLAVGDVDAARPVWSAPPRRFTPAQLAWSPDGRRLLLRGPGRLLLANVGTRRFIPRPVPTGHRVDAAAWAPRAPDRLAVLYTRPGGLREVRAGDRRLLASTGDLTGLSWSPDGRRLLVRWGGADQWLLLPTRPGPPVVAIADISRRFGEAVPVVRGWCCARR